MRACLSVILLLFVSACQANEDSEFSSFDSIENDINSASENFIENTQLLLSSIDPGIEEDARLTTVMF